MGVVINAMHHLFYSLERILVPILEEAVLSPRLVWTDVEKRNF